MKTKLKFITVIMLFAAMIFTACDDSGIIPGYKVTYHGNGNTAGTVPVDSNVYDNGETVTVLGNTGNLVKYGSFIGWNTNAAGTGTTCTAGQTFKIAAEGVDLYAKWSSSDYAVGDTGPAGGIIFYDKGVYSDGWRFLESAPYSTEWYSRLWGGYGTVISGTGTGPGTGKANTTAIVAWLNSNTDDANGDVTFKTSRAAYLCDTLSSGGYSDWFLPSKDELDKVYENLYMNSGGSFSAAGYWSSSESDSSGSWSQDFSTGTQSVTAKTGALRVRAVRRF